MKKRYQYFGRGGKVCWSKWFEWDNKDYQPKYQLEKHPTLLNEYKE